MAILENCSDECFESNGRTYHKKCDNERRRKSYLKNISKRKSYARTLKSRYAQGRCSASKRGYNWELTMEEYSVLIVDKSCHYCSSVLPETGAGLDRKDNAIGYTYINCIPCCTDCNGLKGKYLTYDEMLAVSALLKSMRSI